MVTTYQYGPTTAGPVSTRHRSRPQAPKQDELAREHLPPRPNPRRG